MHIRIAADGDVRQLHLIRMSVGLWMNLITGTTFERIGEAFVRGVDKHEHSCAPICSPVC